MKNKHLSTQKTVDCYPTLTPLERQRLYWFEKLDYFETPLCLNEQKDIGHINNVENIKEAL